MIKGDKISTPLSGSLPLIKCVSRNDTIKGVYRVISFINKGIKYVDTFIGVYSNSLNGVL